METPRNKPGEDPPLRAFFEAEGQALPAKRRSLNAEEVEELVRAGASRFVLERFGHTFEPPRWLTPEEFKTLWKEELRSRLSDPSWAGMCFASEHRTEKNEVIVVFTSGYAPI